MTGLRLSQDIEHVHPCDSVPLWAAVTARMLIQLLEERVMPFITANIEQHKTESSDIASE